MSTNQQTTGSNEILNADLTKNLVVLAAGKKQSVTVSPAVTASAYSIGYTMGGILTFANALRIAGGSGYLVNAFVSLLAAFTGGGRLYLFSKLPTGTYNDHAACNLTVADRANLTGVAHISDITSTGSVIANVDQMNTQPIPVFNNETTLATNVYGLFVVDAAVTPGTTGDFSLTAIFDQD